MRSQLNNKVDVAVFMKKSLGKRKKWAVAVGSFQKKEKRKKEKGSASGIRKGI
jgi:hypothetical protein